LRVFLAVGVLALVIGAAAAIAALGGGGGSNNDRASDALPATTTQTAPATTTAAPTTTATTPAPAPAKKKKKPAGKKPAAPTQVVVRLVPTDQASYLCVDHGPGTPTTETTLATPLTFKGRRVRINVGLNSVRVTVNGKPFALAFSPSGYDIRVNKRTYLAQGQRPCA
jgi:hypothetical protein